MKIKRIKQIIEKMKFNTVSCDICKIDIHRVS